MYVDKEVQIDENIEHSNEESSLDFSDNQSFSSDDDIYFDTYSGNLLNI